MILAIAVSEMATDIYVPSLPHLTHYFYTTEEMVALTLSLNLWGLGIASAFYGPLSDAYGRKIILLGGAFNLHSCFLPMRIFSFR